MAIPDRALLGRNKLFRGIALESVERVLAGCRPVALKCGATLLEAGRKNTSLYLVLEGELRVYLNGRDLPVHAVLGPGECAGELSLIDGGNTAALVMAARDSRLLAVPHERVWAMVDSSHGIARNLLSILAGRIRNDNLLQVTTSESRLEFEVAANIDALTGLHNKGWMGDAFPRMALRYERSGVPLFLLLADIDRFKEFNDFHGRLAGDGILKGMARVMAANLRPQDLLAYLGGDSFAILLPEKSHDGAVKMADRLRAAMAAPMLRSGGARQADGAAGSTREESVTISLGISEVQRGDTLDTVLAAAADALREARTDGCNRVKMAARSRDAGAGA